MTVNEYHPVNLSPVRYNPRMRYLYTLISYLAVPFVLARVLWRSRKLVGYRQRLAERFGYYRLAPLQESIWVHTVSVGEFMAALPMIKALLERYPQCSLVVTTTTPTGSEQVLKHFSAQVVHVYTPYDLPGTVKRFFEKMRPRVGIIMETELWPNLLHEAKLRGIPLMLANARLSARSCANYAKVSSVARDMLCCFRKVAAQCQADGDRFVSLGLPASALAVTGNIKFDVEVPVELLAMGRQLKAEWGPRFVLTVASTHEGEEVIVLRLFEQLKKAFPQLLLLLVPRHPDRFDKVAELCQGAGLSIARRSQQDEVSEQTDVLLGDTMGELKLFFAASDLVLMGGSLVPIGGHNFIEPSIVGVPCVSGHYLHNFVAVRDMLLAENALLVADDEATLLAHCQALIQDDSRRMAMGERARAVVMKNQGALQRHLDLIADLYAG
jgi:3-deoxy-D-manno-octulosonic-acid transferase